MIFLYHIAIHCYGLIIRLAAIFNPKARLWVAGRKGWYNNLVEKLPKNKKLIWFHCASLGEFEQGKPVMEQLKREKPEYGLLITFFSPSGFEIRKNYKEADVVCYLPIDTKSNARKFLQITNPSIAVMVKYEFWYNYLNQLKNFNIPVIVIAALFRNDHFVFRWYAKKTKKLLQNIEHIFVQNKESANILKTHKFINFTICGDTRFDRVFETSLKAETIPVVELFNKTTDKIIITGSSWPEEENLLFPYINNNTRSIKFIIAPHDISLTHINQICNQLKVSYQLFSNLDDNSNYDFVVLVIDNIGLLSRLYLYGDIAIIGGGFSGSVHNILEPATFGLPILIGPHHDKFPEVDMIVSKGGGFIVKTADDVKRHLDFLLNDTMILRMASEMSRNFVIENKGATAKITGEILKLL